MYCRKCGAELTQGIICEKCGADNSENNKEESVVSIQTEKQIGKIEKDKKISAWVWSSIVSFIISLFFCYKGWHHMTQYSSGDYYPYEAINAYVGGDAYNYIINGTYATSYFVICLIFVTLGLGFMVLNYVSKNTKRE